VDKVGTTTFDRVLGGWEVLQRLGVQWNALTTVNRHEVGDVLVQMCDTALERWLGMDRVGLCVQARTRGPALALEHTGDLYSWEH
jgi:sulfatase maturation enzyme AslB (radical SAM superfamily)